MHSCREKGTWFPFEVTMTLFKEWVPAVSMWLELTHSLTHLPLGNFNEFKPILEINGWGITREIALTWMSVNLADDNLTLVHVMAWCRQATSHYLSQWRPRSMSPYGIIRQQWVKWVPRADNEGFLFQKKKVSDLIFVSYARWKTQPKNIHRENPRPDSKVFVDIEAQQPCFSHLGPCFSPTCHVFHIT